jgi:hypothetical protein
MLFPETFHLAERKWNVSFFGCVGVHLPRNVHLPSFRHLSAWRNKSGKSVQAPRPMFRFLSTRWHFGGTQTAESDLRTISMSYQKWKARGPWRRNEVTLLAPANHQSGRCEDARRTRPRRRCARRLLRLISHCKHAVESLTTLPQRPGQHSTPRDQPAARDCQPPSGRCADARRTSRRRCVRRAASRRRGSDFVSPPGLRHARVPSEPSISKSGPGDPEFEDPMVVFKIEGPRHKIVTPGDPSVTGDCFMSKVGAVVSLLVSVILGSVAARFSIFDSSMGLPATVRGGARTSNFSKPVALRGPCIAFGPRFITPSGVRSTPDTTGPGGPLP